MREHDILVKGSKTELFCTGVEFLGFEISSQGWAPTESKVEVVLDWPAPETVKRLHSFLGMAIFSALSFHPFLKWWHRSQTC